MKAISPVIATVIIVAVAIAISIAVALWITGLTSSFTGVEKLEIVNAYATGSGGTYTVHITIKNTGTKIATIDNVFVNNTPLTALPTVASSSGTVSSTTTGITMYPGSQATIEFTISGSSGQTLSIVIHTASGGQYPATVTLP